MNTSPYPGNSGSISTNETESPQRKLKNQALVLALGALGVVYGDIGTSPLYAIRECFHGHHAIALTQGNIFGAMSLVFWSLTVVVSVKYVIFILLADNHGEGGIFALLGLLSGGGLQWLYAEANVPEIMKLASKLGFPIDAAETTYYLGRVSLFTTGDSKMMRWRKVLFAYMSRNAGTPVAYFGLPANRVVELGAQIQL